MTFKLVLVFVPLLLLAIGPCSKTNSSHNTNSESPQVTKEEQKGEEYKVFALGADPDAVSLGNTVQVLFSVLVTGGEKSPESLTLVEVDKSGKSIKSIGILQDNGKNGDVMQQDRIFSGIVSLSGGEKGRRFFQAQFTYSNSDYRSPLYAWTVTSFPLGPAPSDPNFIVTDPNTAHKLYSNEIIISFVKGTSTSRITDIAAERKARIIGTIPSLGVFQLWISNDGTAAGVYVAVKAFQAYKEVEYAEPNYVVELDEQ